jgi:hypothetical protein
MGGLPVDWVIDDIRDDFGGQTTSLSGRQAQPQVHAWQTDQDSIIAHIDDRPQARRRKLPGGGMEDKLEDGSFGRRELLEG